MESIKYTEIAALEDKKRVTEICWNNGILCGKHYKIGGRGGVELSDKICVVD